MMGNRAWVFFSWALAASALLIWWTFTRVVELSGFAAALGKAVLAMVLFYVFDTYVLKTIDTVQELKRGNVAYALFLLGYAIVVAACVATA